MTTHRTALLADKYIGRNLTASDPHEYPADEGALAVMPDLQRLRARQRDCFGTGGRVKSYRE
jgi:hypothetical protein